MRPAVIRPGAGTSRTSASAVSDLPLPDSPTRPSVSPRSRPNDTSATTGSGPPGDGTATERCSTKSNGATAGTSGLQAELVKRAAPVDSPGDGMSGAF